MESTRTWIGAIASILWLGWMGWFWWDQPPNAQALTLNEWGDFFAGVAAPLAFLWLVLGYVQQGEELQNSIKALNLQAEELKKSVEQQSNLVEVSRRQLEQEREVINFQRAQQEELLKPMFNWERDGVTSGPQGTMVYVILHNIGNNITNVILSFDGTNSYAHGLTIPTLNKFKSQRLELHFPDGIKIISIDAIYTDSVNRAGNAGFQIALDERHEVTFLLVKPPSLMEQIVPAR